MADPRQHRYSSSDASSSPWAASSPSTVSTPSTAFAAFSRSPSIGSFDELGFEAQRSPLLGRRGKYKLFNGFSCSGGASRGAKMAGLEPVLAFDENANACKSYGSNFPTAKVIRTEAADFASSQHTIPRVHVAHLYPPCRYFSPAHTIPGPNDKNHDSLYTVGPLIQKFYPDIVTIEQTFGLLTRHPRDFQGLIQMIIAEGYSIAWKIADLWRFGLAQPRKRLLLVASRPGVLLPKFPAYTHGPPGSGLKKFVTPFDALKGISRNASHHIFNDTITKNLKPYDPHTVKAVKTITRSGGGNIHWSGRRTLTPREFARLQGFPDNHYFAGSNTAVIGQIGDAFPPPAAKLLFEECIRILDDYYAATGEDPAADSRRRLGRKENLRAQLTSSTRRKRSYDGTFKFQDDADVIVIDD